MPASFEGDDDGDLEGDLAALTNGGVERDEIASGVVPRLPVPISPLSRCTRLLVEAAASA